MNFDHRLSVAPMMEWTDRHYRYLMRLLCRRTVLYTEMVNAAALVYADPKRFLSFHPIEHPLVLQLGGSDPLLLGKAAQIAAEYGYDALNLNLGCPSPRVQKGRFGACLMAEPEQVLECIQAMQEASPLPVTVKTRLGLGRASVEEFLYPLLQKLQPQGLPWFIIHARNAWLEGLSPKENRTLPPLDYSAVKQLQIDFPDLQFILNGGIDHLEQVLSLTQEFSGLMLGRAAYHQPYLMAEAEKAVYADSEPLPTRAFVVKQYYSYLEAELQAGERLYSVVKPLLGLFLGQPKGRLWRRLLSGSAQSNDPGILLQALEEIEC